MSRHRVPAGCGARSPLRPFAQFDRGQISGVVKDETGGVVPGVTVTATLVSTQTPRETVTDAGGFYTFANLPAGRYNISAELQGFKKSIKEGVQLDAAGALTIDLALSSRRDQRERHRHRRADAAPDRRRAAQDRRVEGHRAAVVQRPQPDRRRRPEAGRHRRQLQQLQLLRPRQRRLQHQRQPQRREQHHASTAQPPSAPARPARSSASRTSTRSRKCRS